MNKPEQVTALATAARVWARRTGRPLNLADIRDLKAERGYACDENKALRLAVTVAKTDAEHAIIP